jgi:site-specific DNA-adenine methylase
VANHGFQDEIEHLKKNPTLRDDQTIINKEELKKLQDEIETLEKNPTLSDDQTVIDKEELKQLYKANEKLKKLNKKRQVARQSLASDDEGSA